MKFDENEAYDLYAIQWKHLRKTLVETQLIKHKHYVNSIGLSVYRIQVELLSSVKPQDGCMDWNTECIRF